MNLDLFIKYLKIDSDKYQKFLKYQKSGLIQPFDQQVLINLRKTYFSGFSGIIFLYGFPNIHNFFYEKLKIISYVLRNYEYDVVNGDIDFIKKMVKTNTTINTNTFRIVQSDEDFKIDINEDNRMVKSNSWLEVKIGSKIWVYDLLTMLRFEKNVYYELVNPEVHNRNPNNGIFDNDFSKIEKNYVLLEYMSLLEKWLDYNHYKEFVEAELSRFKAEMDYDKFVFKYYESLDKLYNHYYNKRV